MGDALSMVVLIAIVIVIVGIVFSVYKSKKR